MMPDVTVEEWLIAGGCISSVLMLRVREEFMQRGHTADAWMATWVLAWMVVSIGLAAGRLVWLAWKRA